MARETASALLWCGALFCVSFANAEEKTTSLQLLFSDDFTHNAPTQYDIEGPNNGFVVKDGKLALSTGTKVSRSIQASQQVAVELDLQVPNEIRDGDVLDFSAGFSLNTFQFRCSIHRYSSNLPGKGTLSFELISNDGARLWSRWRTVELENPNGRWRLTCENGQVAVYQNGQRLFKYFVSPSALLDINRVDIQSHGAAVSINSLVCHGRQLSAEERDRLLAYEGRAEQLAMARAASADQHHQKAAPIWRACIDGWPMFDEQTTSVAFIQMEAGLAEISSGSVINGLSRLEQAWPAIISDVEEDHPWRVAGEALLREAYQQLKQVVPDETSRANWDVQVSQQWKAWAGLSWKGKSSLEHDVQHVQRRWQQMSQLDEMMLDKLKRIQRRSALANASFAHGNAKLALEQAGTAVTELEVMLDRDGNRFSFLREDLGDLLTLVASCQFQLPDLDLKELDRQVRSAQKHWTASLPEDHPKHLVAAYNISCMEYLSGNWLESERGLQKLCQRATELLGEGASETLEAKSSLCMLQRNCGHAIPSNKMRADTLWRYAELTIAGWLPIGRPTLDVLSVRQELAKHPSLIIVFSHLAPSPRAFDPLAVHADSLTLARLAGRVDQLMTPFFGSTPWVDPSKRAKTAVAGLARDESPLHTMSQWLGTGHLRDEEIAALPESHPWRVWLQRRQAIKSFDASQSPPAAPVTDLDFRMTAFQALQNALEESITIFGENHPESAWCHESLAIANYTLGRFDEAKAHAEKSSALFTESLGRRHYRTLAVQNTLGVIEYYRQNMAPAYEILQQNVRDRRDTLGDLHIETLRSLSDVAVVARGVGQIDVARGLLDLTIKGWPESDKTAQQYKDVVLVNRCVLQAESGDYSSAQAALEELLQKASIPSHEILVSLSSVAIMRDDYLAAEQYLLQAQELRNDPLVDHSLGVVYRELGKLNLSHMHLEKALQQRRDAQFGAPYALGDTLTSLGILEQKEGNVNKALALFLEATNSYMQRLGPTGLRQADSLRRVALAAHLTGNNDLAVTSGQFALKLKCQLVGALAPSLSEAETQLFANTLTELEPLLSALSVDREGNAAAAVEAVWKRKAIVSHLLERRSVRLRSVADTELTKKTDQLRLLRRELSTLLGSQFRSPLFANSRLTEQGRIPPGANVLQRIQELTAEKESLERELSGYAGHDELPFEATVDAVSQGMDPGTALIEFAKVNIWTRSDDAPHQANAQPEARYQVFVLYKSANEEVQISWHDLGSAAEIDQSISELRGFIHSEMQQARGVTVSDDDANVLKDRSIRKRIAKQVSGAWIDLVPSCTHLHIVPDGLLHGLPWAALPGCRSEYIIEEASISLLSRGPELSKQYSQEVSFTNFLLVGDVTYGDAAERSLPSPIWEALQGTREELLSIRRIAGDQFAVTRLENEDATEATTVRRMETAHVAHFATHGFFTPPPVNKSGFDISTSTWRDPILASPAGRNPLGRCGVVLAGANYLPEFDVQGIPYGDDGLLTGEEVCDLDLRSVAIVVLSACETGLGQIADNEGTFGLHRALSRAGAQATVGSLWKVSDAATMRLMTEFYENLLTKDVGVAEALRQAQLRLLENGTDGTGSEFNAPYFWGGFIVSGRHDVKVSGGHPQAADPVQAPSATRR